jgi:hypothetical protein
MALEAHSHCEVPAGCVGVAFLELLRTPGGDLCFDGKELDE